MHMLFFVILLVCNWYTDLVCNLYDIELLQKFCITNSAIFEPVLFYDGIDFLRLSLSQLEKGSYFAWLNTIITISSNGVKKMKRLKNFYTNNNNAAYIKEYILLQSDIHNCLYKQQVSYHDLSVFFKVMQKNIILYFDRDDVQKYSTLSINRSFEVLKILEPFESETKEKIINLKKHYLSVLQKRLQ